MRRYLLISLVVFTGYNLNAQVITPVSGGNASGTGGSVSYTIGQTFIPGTDNPAIISQGFQQPYEIMLVGINEREGIKIDCSLYPNPADEYVKLTVNNYDGGRLTCYLLDLGGSLLFKEKIQGSEIVIPMRNRAKGTYLLKLSDDKQDLRIFKIIKR